MKATRFPEATLNAKTVFGVVEKVREREKHEFVAAAFCFVDFSSAYGGVMNHPIELIFQN